MRALLLLALLLLAARCHSPVPPGRAQVVSVVPAAAEVSAADLRDGIRVSFDRPVAPPPGAAAPIAGAAFEIVPAIAGEARWLDARTLAFFPTRALAPSTLYRVRLAPRLATAAGVTLAAWKGVRFVHERVRIERITLAGLPAFQPAEPLAALHTNVPVRPGDAARACAFHERRGDGGLAGEIQARPAADQDAEEPAPMVRLAPVRALRPATSHLLRCGTGLEAGGGEGLAEPQELAFTTHGEPGVAGFSPQGDDVSADEVRVEVRFATPMRPEEVRQRVKLLPAGGKPLAIELTGSNSGTSFAWAGDLAPGTDFELVVEPPLADVLGQRLIREVRHRFRVGDASPRLHLERGIYLVERASGRYPVWTRNLAGFQLRCAAVPEARLTAVLTGPANYDSWYDAASEGVDYRALGLAVRQREVATPGPRNRWFDASLSLASSCGSGGVYLVDVSASPAVPESRWAQQRRSLVNVTDLGLLAKVGNASSLVWVVRLSTGQPVAGALVKLRDLRGQVRFTARTTTEGVVLAPGAARLAGVRPRGETDSAGEAHDDDDGGEWEDHRARRMVVTAQLGDDLAILDTSWNNGVQIWNFGVDQDRRGGQVRVRGFLHSDRGLYRPGETVHLRGLVRTVDLAGKMTVPRRRKVRVVIEDPRHARIVEEELELSGYGGFSRDLVLPGEARLGDYRVSAEVDGQKFSDRFSVEEYRPRTFEVKIEAPGDLFLGRPLRFVVGASYLHGSALRAGKLSWSLRRREHLPRFAGFDEYVFQDFGAQAAAGRWWARSDERSFSEPVADGQAALDAAGRAAVLARDDAARGLPGPQDYLFEATVEEAAGSGVVTIQKVVRGHRADLYLGVHPAELVQAAGMPFAVQLVAFDAAGKRRAAAAELTLTRRSYRCGHEPDRWGCERQDASAPAITRRVSIPAAGSAAVERVVLSEPGEYLVRVTGADGRGQTTVSSDLIYVIGKGEAFWSGDEGDRMTVIASKARYRSGETARLVPQAQLPGALALVTLERDGILSHRLVRLATSGEAIELRIEARLAPNVFASIVLVRGRSGDGDGGRPRFKMGVVDLVVDSSDRRLLVDVATDRPSYRPGQQVRVKLTVTGAGGRPARAELAVAVADEGVLQIAGFRTPDPLPAFYAPWGLGVESATTWNRLLRARHPDLADDDEQGGDSGGDEAGRIRSRFLATAFWAPAVVTDAAGRADVVFTAPDNLTAFRVMAVAADGADRFGAGERRFTVAKPLQAIPALPRFLTVGDQARATVVLHNNTRTALEVTLGAAMSGVELQAGAPAVQRIAVPAGEARPAHFAVLARSEGQASFRFSASGGGHADAVEVRLPVSRPALTDVLVVGEGATAGRAQHALPRVPPGADRITLAVSVDATGLSRLEEGLRYLVGYPHGCLEQTTSKVIPMVAAGDLARVIAQREEASPDRTRGFISAGIAKILRHQHPDGGFGLWPGAAPETHYTAYALWGLEVARAAGHPVDRAALDSGAGYLRRRLAATASAGGSAAELAGEGGASAFAAYVLTALGHADPGALAQLHERRQQLPVFGRAFLARALEAAGRHELAAAVVGELVGLLPGGQGPALVREGQHDLGWYWSSDGRTTALVLLALLETAPGHPAIGRLAEGLLAARVDGRWQSTQENVYGLLALAELGKARVAGGAAAATVSLGGKPLGPGRIVGGRAPGQLRVRLTAAQLGAGPLLIESAGRELFYSARLEVERPLSGGAAEERGLRVERAYLDPGSGQPLTRIAVGQTVRIRVTVHSPIRLAHVAVVDPLPAGLEPVLERFERSVTPEGGAGRSLWWGSGQTAWQHQELRDDRAALFADVLAAGTSQREYLARATTAGTFAAPPVAAEAMYRPAIRGRSVAATVVVEPR